MNESIGVLMMAYGGPDKLADIEAYLHDVRGGRQISKAQVAEIVRRYELVGGRSPLLEETQAQARGLQAELDKLEPPLFQVFVGMRHWHPTIPKAVSDIASANIKKLVALVMAPHYSKMSVEVYFKRLDETLDDLSAHIEVAHIDSWKEDPGYLDTLEAHIRDGLKEIPDSVEPNTHLVFTAHSLPESILSWNDPYPQELRATCRALQSRFPDRETHFAYQSAAMLPDPWLGPDAGDLMVNLITQSIKNFLVVPIGFVARNVEILYDIDIAFKEQVKAAGGMLWRIKMPGSNPLMMASLGRLVRQTAKTERWL